MEKGTYASECNRTACDNKNAQFYNHSTKKYYCGSCAKKINDLNYADAQKMFGHLLCTHGEHIPDLFERPELIPDNVQAIIDEFSQCTDDPYKACEQLVSKLETVGYTCDYYLDAEPFDLRKL